MGRTRKACNDLANSGLTSQSDLGREYVWNAQGQLTSIRLKNRELVRYPTITKPLQSEHPEGRAAGIAGSGAERTPP